MDSVLLLKTPIKIDTGKGRTPIVLCYISKVVKEGRRLVVYFGNYGFYAPMSFRDFKKLIGNQCEWLKVNPNLYFPLPLLKQKRNSELVTDIETYCKNLDCIECLEIKKEKYIITISMCKVKDGELDMLYKIINTKKNIHWSLNFIN